MRLRDGADPPGGGLRQPAASLEVGARWDGGDAGRARVEMELGYGLGVRWGEAGVLTPYGGFGYEEGGARRYRLGTRLDLGGAVDLSLEAERKEGRANPEHGVGLELRIRW